MVHPPHPVHCPDAAAAGRYNRRTLVGRTISHYKILEKLGEGGMGVVYKAEDARLDRTVALKFLAPHLVSNEDVRKRFIREAKTAAAIEHPNICTIHEIDQVDGATFIAMACLEGRDLARRIAEGPLDADRASGYATQFADGLAEAHSKGIVHRDIKPANLFLTSGGRGVILDFGLAQLTTAGSRLTREGTTLGTCAYMAPEQAAGAEIDARADVWALGCVIYEMLAAEPPFRGHYEQAIVYSILNEDPEPLPESAGRLADVVGRCLLKKPDDRFRDGAEVAAALRGTSPAPKAKPRTTTDQRPSVVILPFQNRSSDPEDEYFSDGVTEDVIVTLAKLDDLRVIPRNSAFHFKGKRPQLPEIVEALGVSHVLEGSVRRAGQRVRIAVELIDARQGEQLWAERYDRVLEDIFEVQDEIAKEIADQLEIKLIGNQQLAARPTTNKRAYELYLRGKHQVYRLTGDGILRGIALLKQARELDPGFAQPYAFESFGHIFGTLFGHLPTEEALEQGKSLAAAAIDLNDKLAEAHLYHGMALMYADWDWIQGEAAMRRAGALNAEHPDVQSWLAELLLIVGRPNEALEHAKRTREIDPLSVEALRKVMVCEFFSRDYAACIRTAREALELDPRHALGHANLGMALYLSGEVDEALDAMTAASQSLEFDPMLHSCAAYVFGGSGRLKDARAVLSTLEANRDKGLPTSLFLALALLGLGEHDEALSAYEHAIETREVGAVYTTYPAFDAIRDDPRFHEIRRKLNLA